MNVGSAADLDAISSIRHGFFGRTGGVSAGPFGSLNVGIRNADEKANVAENRRRIAEYLDEGTSPISTVRQVHGAHCAILDRSIGANLDLEADALVTKTPSVALGVTTADCAPILFADPTASVIGAAHAGWRGALSGITRATIASMEELGARPSHMIAAIGPCIAQQSYEVGDELQGAFLKDEPGNRRYFSTLDGRLSFDLRGYLTDRLKAEGVGRVTHVAKDTYADKQGFFSYRRTTHEGGGSFGLQLSAILICPPDKDC